MLFMFLTLILIRPIVKFIIGVFIKRLMTDHYSANLWEMYTALSHRGPTSVIENSLRATTGEQIDRPFGSVRKFLNFDGLMFSAAQLAVLPSDMDAEVDMRIVIGPNARKPLTLDIPIMAGALGYGLGVSEQVRIAMAIATANVGTATNVGEGGFLPEDRAAAKYLILQYHAATWSKEEAIIKQADAIEIHIGQGASAGAMIKIPASLLEGKAAEIMNVQGIDPVIIPPKLECMRNLKDLKKLVTTLRRQTEGVPIGVKIATGARLEADLEIAIQAKVDFISIDGAEAGTKGSPPTLEDDFGLPTIYALPRAVRYLRERHVKHKITLLSGGGYSNPGHILKALALGADGVYLGTSLLWAMTHDQVTKAVPWEPPTQVTFYSGAMAHRFDIDKASAALTNFFQSYKDEMQTAIRAMGKASIHDLSNDDLVALDEWTSDVTNVPLAYKRTKP